PVMLALALDFAGPQPRHFGAPRARSQPFEAAGFEGSVERGASCNCELITLIPHCNGTHTECVGHLTREPLDAWRVVPAGFLPALLLSVSAEAPGAAGLGAARRRGAAPRHHHRARFHARRAGRRRLPPRAASAGARRGCGAEPPVAVSVDDAGVMSGESTLEAARARDALDPLRGF